MAEWSNILGPDIPEELDAAANGVSDSLSAFEEALQTAEEAVNDVALILSILETADPVQAALQILADTLEAYIRDLLNTGAYFLPVLPGPAFTEFFRPFPTEAALQMISDSLSDRLDSERPQSSPLAGYGAVVVLGGANTFFDFIGLIDSFRKLFGDQSKWGQLGDLFENLEFETLKPVRGSRKSEGVGWNWTSFRLEEIEAVESALLSMLGFVQSIQQGTTQVLQKLFRILRKRIAYYIKVARRIIAFLEFLRSLSEFAANVQALAVGGLSGGVAKMQSDIVNSAKKPQFEYAVGFVLASVFPAGVDEEGFIPFKTFSTFFGVQESLWEGVFNSP